MAEYYTSDHHFGHHGMLKFCARNRFVQTAEEMDEYMANKWNSRVNHGDIVWHLGDVFFSNHEILGELKGLKKLIVGNHDYKKLKILKQYFDIEKDSIIVDKRKQLVLCHYPIWDWPQKFHGYYHFHGHTHGFCKMGHPKAFDVGVDCWDYYPMTFQEIINGQRYK